MKTLKRRMPSIPKTLFTFLYKRRRFHFSVYLETTWEPKISASIVLPHQLSVYNSSPFNYEAGVYVSFFLLSFRFQINWM
jgi:hypothetical protein